MRLGIIDIGYNAIRAVVYESNEIGAPEIFNNKFKNDILSLLTKDKLDVKHQAYLCIQYMLHIFDKLAVTDVRCVATAVLRNHPKADNFIDFIKKKFNLTIEIITGEREAYLTALGLISGISEVDGIAADLGGGSLELIEVKKQAIGRLASLGLGTKIITEQNLQNLDELTKLIKQDYGDYQYDNLYLIGGALRFIARFFVEFHKYPLKNLHNLIIPSNELRSYLEIVQDKQNIDKSNHGKTLNENAILVLQSMIEVFKPQNIVISIFGLKEGVRYEMLPEAQKNQDIVLQKALYCSKYDLQKTDFDSYYQIIRPLVEDSEYLHKIFKIAIILQSLTKYLDHTLPIKTMNDYILNSEIPFTHKQRIMVATIIAYSSNFKADFEIIKMAKKFLSNQDFCNAQIIGYFIRIAKDIDGFDFTKPSFSISIKNHYLEIVSKDVLPRPIFDKIRDKLKSIAYVRKFRSNEFDSTV